MTAIIIPFDNSPDHCEPTPAERLAARRIYRAGCKEIAPEAMGRAFTVAGRLPGVAALGVDDALPIFVAAMRRELRKTGMLPRPRGPDRQPAPATPP